MPERAQTTFDFAVGITLFLLVVSFAFAATPGFLAPYQGSGESEAILSDRVATRMATENLTDGQAYVLNGTKVQRLFNDVSAAKSELGVKDTYGLNVTLRRENGTCPADLSTCASNETPPESASVSRSQRVVTIGGESVDLTVRVWR